MEIKWLMGGIKVFNVDLIGLW